MSCLLPLLVVSSNTCIHLVYKPFWQSEEGKTTSTQFWSTLYCSHFLQKKIEAFGGKKSSGNLSWGSNKFGFHNICLKSLCHYKRIKKWSGVWWTDTKTNFEKNFLRKNGSAPTEFGHRVGFWSGKRCVFIYFHESRYFAAGSPISSKNKDTSFSS